jgi:hypothetical protein
MREMSGAEQEYQALPAVISDGRTVTEVVAGQWRVSRPTLHGWLAAMRGRT